MLRSMLRAEKSWYGRKYNIHVATCNMRVHIATSKVYFERCKTAFKVVNRRKTTLLCMTAHLVGGTSDDIAAICRVKMSERPACKPFRSASDPVAD